MKLLPIFFLLGCGINILKNFIVVVGKKNPTGWHLYLVKLCFCLPLGEVLEREVTHHPYTYPIQLNFYLKKCWCIYNLILVLYSHVWDVVVLWIWDLVWIILCFFFLDDTFSVSWCRRTIDNMHFPPIVNNFIFLLLSTICKNNCCNP